MNRQDRNLAQETPGSIALSSLFNASGRVLLMQIPPLNALRQFVIMNPVAQVIAASFTSTGQCTTFISFRSLGCDSS